MRDRVQNSDRRIDPALFDLHQRSPTDLGPFRQLVKSQIGIHPCPGDGMPQRGDVRLRRGLGHVNQRNGCAAHCQCSILP